MSMKHSVGMMAVVGILASGCSQGVEADDFDGDVEGAVSAGGAAAPLATLQLGGEHKLEVHEVAPGDFLFVESLAQGEKQLDASALQAQPLSELYRSLLPDREVPANVLRATERQLAASSQNPARDVGAAGAASGAAKVTSSAPSAAPDGFRALIDPDWVWRTNNCHAVGEPISPGDDDSPAGVDAVLCKLRQSVNQWGHISNAHAAQAKVEVWQGSVTVAISHNFGDGAVEDKRVTVSANHSTRFWRYRTSDTFAMHVDVSGATSSDLFNLALFGTGSKNRDVLDCYDGGYHCGLGVIVQQ